MKRTKEEGRRLLLLSLERPRFTRFSYFLLSSIHSSLKNQVIQIFSQIILILHNFLLLLFFSTQEEVEQKRSCKPFCYFTQQNIQKGEDHQNHLESLLEGEKRNKPQMVMMVKEEVMEETSCSSSSCAWKSYKWSPSSWSDGRRWEDEMESVKIKQRERGPEGKWRSSSCDLILRKVLPGESLLPLMIIILMLKEIEGERSKIQFKRGKPF